MNKNKISIIILVSFILNFTSFLFIPNISLAQEDNQIREKYRGKEQKNYVEGEVIIKYKKNKRNDFDDKISNIKKLGFELKQKENKQGFASIKSSSKKTIDIINELKNDKDIEYIQPNYIYSLQSLNNFNDSQKDNQWGLYNFGQDIEGQTGNSGSDISFGQASSIFTGSSNQTTTGVIVAVIDTGIAYNHPDLINKIWDGSNCLNHEGNFLGGCIGGYDFDNSDKDPILFKESHGTHVAGIIAAEMNNGKGIIGVNPNAKIMALKTEIFTTQSIVNAINFAKYNNAKIINASFGAYEWIDKLLYDTIKDFGENGGLFIAAAGNGDIFGVGQDHDLLGTGRLFPAGYSVDNYDSTNNLTLTGLTNIISVAATDNQDNLASFSDYGHNSVHIGAPGVSIYSTVGGTGTTTYFEEKFLTSDTGSVYSFQTGGTNNNFGANYGIKGIWGDKNSPFLTGSNNSYIEKNIDISNIKIPQLNFNVWCDAGKDSYAYTDYMRLSFSTGGNFTEIDKIDYWNLFFIGNESTINGHSGYYGRLSYDLSKYKSSNFKFRFTWVSDTQETSDLGCVIYGTEGYPLNVVGLDDGAQEVYEFYNGTSMATPQVVGLASLAWSYKPNLNYLDIKNAILNNGDSISSLSGKTITGKRINAYKTLDSLTPVEGSLNFLSGAYTNTGLTNLSFTSNKNGTYYLSGDLNNSLTGVYSTGKILDIGLNNGDGTKNIYLELTDDYGNNKILTGSIILDTTLPILSSLSIENNDKFSTGTITVTGVVNDVNKDKIKVNTEETSLSGSGNFSKNISLNAGINNINFEMSDKAGNTGSISKQIIRIGTSPGLDVESSFGKIKFNLSKEFAGTGVILYGTGELNNTLTGVYSTGETLEINAISNTTYYYKAYYINNSFDSVISNTGTIKTETFINSNSNGENSVTGSINIIDATNSGIVFSQTGSIEIKTQSGSFIKLDITGLEIKTQSGSWDGIINPPEKTGSTGSISLNGYSRINELTFKIGSDSDNLIFSGGKVEVNINVGSGYNGKTLKVYRSGDNQKTFEYLKDCLVSNGICKFETTKFSHFTFMQANPVIVSSSSSGGGGGGGGGGGSYTQTTTTSSGSQNKTSTNTATGTIKNTDITTKEVKQISKKIIDYKGYKLNSYEGYDFSKKIEKLSKSIIEIKKISDETKKSFINNLNNFLIAKYELNNSKEKSTKLKNNYNKQIILLKNSIKKLNNELKKKK